MQERFCRLANRGFGLLEVLLFGIALLFLGSFVVKTYLKKPALDESIQETLVEQGINASSQQAVLEIARERLKDYNKQILNRQTELDNLN